MKNETTKKIATNIGWAYGEKILSYILQFVTSTILARILDPSSFYTITIINVILTLLQTIMDCGLSSSLIQKKDADIYDFSTIFFANTVLGCLLYVVLFVVAPYIAQFYNDPEITVIIRVMGIWLIGVSIKNVYNAYIVKRLEYKSFFWASFLGTVLGGIVSVTLALKGYGVWSLVALHVIDNSIDAIILFIVVKFKPKLYFSFNRLKSLMNFGGKLFITNMINSIYNEARMLVVGKFIDQDSFVYYEKGRRYPSILHNFLSNVIDNIVFSLMSETQDEKEKIKVCAIYSNRMYSYVLWPIMFGFAAISNTFVLLFLTEKWIFIVPYIMIFCIYYGTMPMTITNINVIKSLGDGDTLLKKEIIKKSIASLITIIFVPLGPLWLALSDIIYGPIDHTVYQVTVQKRINYRIVDQYKDTLPHFFMGLIMGLCVYFVGLINMPLLVKLIVQILIGVIVYVVESIIFKSSMFRYLVIYVRNNILKKRNG